MMIDYIKQMEALSIRIQIKYLRENFFFDLLFENQNSSTQPINDTQSLKTIDTNQWQKVH